MTQIQISNDRKSAADSGPSIWDDVARRMEEVRARAFELFQLRGAEPGHEIEDWLVAEREVLSAPEARMRDADDHYEVEVKLPGFASDEIEVAASADEVIVHATAEREATRENAYETWSEFGSRDVFRRFALPEPIDIDKVTADFDEGILRLRVHKATPVAAEPVA